LLSPRDSAGPQADSDLELDLDVDAGGEVELHQRVHGLRRRIDDVEQALVGADLELLARTSCRRAANGSR
jgi:hypothetical protein